MSAEKYVRDYVDNVEKNLAKYNQRLPTCCKTPIMSIYQPETDTLPNLKPKGVTQYQEMIRVIRWVVDLGRVDIILEMALISTYLALPHREHTEQVFQMFRCLKPNPERKF